MAYRITYGKDALSTPAREISALKVQFLAACCFLAAVLLIRRMLPDSEQILLTVFQPVDNSATEVMAQVLARGGTMRESFIAFCRGILEASGYAS